MSEGRAVMTPPDLAARVAALLDAGCPGHVRDLYEDLAADLGERPAAGALREAVVIYRIGRALAGCAPDDMLLAAARGLAREFSEKIKPGR
jgi:hypothetical protein